MTFLNTLHATIRQNLFWLERLLIAGGLTALLWQLFNAQPVYPLYWDSAILAAIFLMLVFWPTAGYFALLLATLYPLSAISVHVAALVLAIGLIGQHWFIPNMGLLTLVLAAPFLNGIYLAWLPLLLGGLWWGARGGLLAGLTACLWGKLLFGLLGLNPDWLQLAGLYPDAGPTLLRLSGQTSSQLLTTIWQPLVSDSTTALYHLLQISLWAFMGWATGSLAIKDKIQYHRPRTTIALLIAGIMALSLLHILLFAWLGPREQLAVLFLDSLLPNSLAALGFATLAELLLYFFEHPWSLVRKTPAQHVVPAASFSSLAAAPGKPSESNTGPQSAQPHPKREEDDPLIMIELD